MPNNQENENGCGLKVFQRNNYFYGKLMTVRDFTDEQDYVNDKRQLLNKLIHGSGLVCGFDELTLGTDAENVVHITFPAGGVALDCCGREIAVARLTENKEVLIDETGGKLTADQETVTKYPYLYLKLKECKTEMVNAASNPSSCDETCCPNRIKEDFEVIASTDPPTKPVIDCASFSGLDKEDREKRKGTIRSWVEEAIRECRECEDPKVFLVAINGDLSVNHALTSEYRSFVYNNEFIAELLACHISDFENPHNSLNGLQAQGKKVAKDEEGYITIDKKNAITLSADINNHKITIGETHSARKDNPHDVMVGVKAGTEEVSHVGGYVELQAGTGIKIDPNKSQHKVKISLESTAQDNYKEQDVALKPAASKRIEHGFKRFPVVDVYEKVEQPFLFDPIDKITVAKDLGITAKALGDKSISLKKYTQKKKISISQSPVINIGTLLKKLPTTARLSTTVSKKPSTASVQPMLDKVYVFERYVWKKTLGQAASPDVEVISDKTYVEVRNTSKTGYTLKVILQA